MEELLTPVSTTYKASRLESWGTLIEVQDPPKADSITSQISTPEEALKTLRADPDLDALKFTLKYLVYDAPSNSGFRVTYPSPIAAQLINALVSDVLPNYWPIFNETLSNRNKNSFKYAQERALFLSCLRSAPGLNAILSRLKNLTQQIKGSEKMDKGLTSAGTLRDLIDVLDALLSGEKLVASVWSGLDGNSTQRKALWHEVVVLIGGGRMLNGVAEYSSLINEASSQIVETMWAGDGVKYSQWLARNIIRWSKDLPRTSQGPWKELSELLSKSLHLGYPDVVLHEILGLLLGTDEERSLFGSIIESLPTFEHRVVITSALKLLSNRYVSQSAAFDVPNWWEADSGIISATAGFLNYVIAGQEIRKEQLITWLTSLSGAGVGDNIGIRRVAVTIFSGSKHDMEIILDKSLQNFGDELYIRHTPSLQQEVHAQVLLLSAGYLHRLAPVKLSILIRSSTYLTAISNRLASSAARARFLGMVVGEALSSLVDQPDKHMKFKLDELESPEAKWYKSLTSVCDSVGPMDLLKPAIIARPHGRQKPQSPEIRVKNTQLRGQSKIISIEELSDSSAESEGDNLVPYAKPDSDPEDEDEDPTLVQRNKPIAPVYIRDLIVYLRDTENYDRQKLALSTTSTLIRRKSNFGTEVSDHVEELASLLVGLQDKFNMENFQDMRLQGMIATILSQPPKMGRWFAKTFFEGDYSISQRASILTVLSVAARELGGFKEQDAALTKVDALPSTSFPSKLLPSKLHKIYASEQQLLQSPVDAISQSLSDTMIQPLAASLADKATGPDVLKVRTFSSRLAVESRRKPPSANKLSAVVADSFFFPLTGCFFAHYKAYGGNNIIFESYLLSSYLKTLSLILHASGTSTLQLPQMTSEMWDLLLSLRTEGGNDKTVGQAVLFGFMTLLEINEDKRRFTEVHGRELLETQKWVEIFFERLGAGSEDDDRIRALAAGVLFKIQEIVEKYQALLVGELLGS